MNNIILVGWLIGFYSIVGSNTKEKDASTANETIHIFSVASGHLYERMLGWAVKCSSKV